MEETRIGGIRYEIAQQLGGDSTSATRILYGGSVRTENIALLMAQPDIDGALLGGASLDPETFFRTVRYALPPQAGVDGPGGS